MASTPDIADGDNAADPAEAPVASSAGGGDRSAAPPDPRSRTTPPPGQSSGERAASPAPVAVATAAAVSTGRPPAGAAVSSSVSGADATSRNEATNPTHHRRERRSGTSSLELRKVPTHILLSDEMSRLDDLESVSSRGGIDGKGDNDGQGSSKVGWLLRPCLNSKFSLRTQMLVSFGSASAVTILFVVITAIIASIASGNSIKSESTDSLEYWVRDSLGTYARFVAETLSPKIMPNDLVQITHEVTRDRFAGYPDFANDSKVPFFDTTTQTNVYPLQSPPLPLDWEFVPEHGNINNENYKEHIQDRWSWYDKNPRLSSVSSFYTMQGACDPRETDPNAMSYYPNCTDANNDISTGGVVAPTPTNEQVARKAADLSPLLKALYEWHQDVKELGVFFANGGAGSGVQYPHYEINGRSSYTSIGCNWMRARNPINTSRPIGTQEEINRCHPEGEVVPLREYNPLEQVWCRDQALNPDKIQNIGPFMDTWDPDVWLMNIGRAVYDRVTGEFISCIWASFTLDRIKELIDDVRINEWSKFTLVRWDEDGTVIVSPNFDYDTASGTTTVDNESLNIGVDKNMFEEMKSLVNFSGPWDPQEAREVYETTFYENEGKLVSAYPIPALHNVYDSEYSPEFMVILSVDRKQEIDQAANELEGAVGDEVKDLIVFTVILGFVGLAVVIILIYAVSYHLTEPLKWMADVADQIVGKFGEDLDTGIDYERKKAFRFSPKTELRDLLQEFTKMVSKFSGEGTAKSVKIRPTEVRNCFTLFDEFRDLYQSRKEQGFEYDYEPSSSHQAESDGQYDDAPDRHHFGPNVKTSDGETTAAPSIAQYGEHKVFASPLFLWIVALIVTPLLATTVSISVVVLWNISKELPLLVVPVKEQFSELRTRARYTAATMRAVHASGVTGRSARDLHVLMRLASWLFFDGVPMSGSITEMKSGAEECKSSPGRGTCDYFNRQPCDCAWNDFFGTANCREYVEDSRYLEQVWFEGQSQDAWQNGDRNHTTFPDVDYSPETTAWWSNVEDVPGNKKGPLAAAGHETTYDRLKVASALSTVFVPLFQYDTSADRPVALFVGFEADGMFTGYSGCDNGPADLPFFISSESNGAANIRPELCPIGKYGYDCRCRGWYDVGRKMAMDMEDAGPLYITPPYKFANNDLTAQSASLPLINPKTQTHIGQTLVDFLPDSIFTLLQENTPLATGGFPILITPEKDSLGYDTVIGPGFSLEDLGQSVDDLVLPYDKRNCDEDDCANRQALEKILDDMRAGNTDGTEFSRTTSDGVIEKVHISYAPVVVKNYWPLNSSDFSSGVKEYDSLIYSLALAEPEDGILQPFQAVEDTVNKQVIISIGVLSALIFIATVLILYISNRVTRSITEPILHLLDLIRKINRMEIEKDDVTDIGEFPGSSSEIVSVFDMMEMLYKVVRFANSAFFAGNLDEAYAVLRDALRMFQRLGNKKAIAVACNNLGNMILTMYRTMKVTKEAEICSLNEKEIISKGVVYFQRAIRLGEEAYDQFYEEEGWSKRCLCFMEHLANRYFNRAMFLLTIKDDHPRPQEAMSLGMRDLQIVQDMDVEVVDQCVEVGFSVDKVERYDLMMNRIRGLLTLAKMGYEDDLGVEENIDEVMKRMKVELKNPASELFDSIGPAGRMQQLDTELIRYARDTKKDTTKAARIAIRMLVEDDYTFPEAQYKAVEALVDYVDAQGTEGSEESDLFATRKALQLYQAALEAQYVDQAINHRFSASESSIEVAKSVGKLLKRKSARASTESIQRLSISMRESTRGDFTMEMF